MCFVHNAFIVEYAETNRSEQKYENKLLMEIPRNVSGFAVLIFFSATFRE